MVTVLTSDIYHWTSMAATLHIYVQMHWYGSESIDFTLVHTLFKHLVSDTKK